MKCILALFLLIPLWAAPVWASMDYEIYVMMREWNTLKGEAHPDDVAAIDRLLKINDAENGLMAGRGWQPGRPETWTIDVPVYTPPMALGMGGQKRAAMCLPGVRWTNNRLTEVFLQGCHLTGSLDTEGLGELKTLAVDNNRLAAIKGLESCVQLEELSAGGNQLTDIQGFGGLRNLRRLHLADNRLTKVFPLDCALTATLEAEDFSEVKTLWLVNNSLTASRGLGRLERPRRLTFQELPGLFGPEVSRKLLATFRGLDSYARLAGPDHPGQLPGLVRREIDRHLLIAFKDPPALSRSVRDSSCTGRKPAISRPSRNSVCTGWKSTPVS